MKPGTITSLTQSVQFQRVASHMESFRCINTQSRSAQEKNRIILRGVACRYLLKTYFGKGHFHYKKPYRIYQRCLELLDEYPKPRFLSVFQEQKEVPLFAEVRAVTPVDWLEELRFEPGDDMDIPEAKREAFLCFVFQKFEGLVAGRRPNYRETFDPNTPQSKELPRTVGKDLMQYLMHQVLDILKTHEKHCDPVVWKTLRLFVIEPPLPFNIELPD